MDKKLVAPTVQCLERFRTVDIIDQHATICATIKRNAQGLESFLSSGVPQLDGDQSAIDHHLARKKVGSDRSLVSRRESLVYVCVRIGATHIGSSATFCRHCVRITTYPESPKIWPFSRSNTYDNLSHVLDDTTHTFSKTFFRVAIVLVVYTE